MCCALYITCKLIYNMETPPGGDSHMEWTAMLVVSPWGVNFGFWSRLGCSGSGLVKGCTQRNNKQKELWFFIFSQFIYTGLF